MKVTDIISYKVDRFKKGYVFTYSDFTTEVDNKEAIIKALNRMVENGKIAKLSKGRYYKPEKTTFGELSPSQTEVVKDLIEDNGKITGYLTGLSIYNRLGLTTQVSNTIQIGKNEVRPTFKRGRYSIVFIKQKNTITKENIYLLQILDSIRYIKKIPNSNIQFLLTRFISIIGDLSEKEKISLVKFALKYPPSTRALLGAILDKLGSTNLTASLFKTLNPITKFTLSGAEDVLNTTSKWNII